MSDGSNVPAKTELTPELLEAVLPAIADRVSTDIQKFLGEQLQPLREQFQEFQEQYDADKAAPPQPVQKDDEPNPMELRLKQLETQLAEKEKAEKQARFDAALRDAVDGHGAQYPKEATQYLKTTLADAVDEKKGRWLAKDGRDINDLVKDFFASDFGKHLLPSQHTDGAGVSKADGVTKQPSNVDAEIVAALLG